MVEMHGKARQVAESGALCQGMRLPYSIDTAVDMVNDGAFDKVRKVNVEKRVGTTMSSALLLNRSINGLKITMRSAGPSGDEPDR